MKCSDTSRHTFVNRIRAIFKGFDDSSLKVTVRNPVITLVANICQSDGIGARSLTNTSLLSPIDD